MVKPDLHLCNDSDRSEYSVDQRPCVVCLPEYYCVDYCGEGGTAGSISTLISWQHFPRSTSSRSRCDDLSEESRKSLPELPTQPEKEEEEKETTHVSSIVYPRSKTIAELRILHYLEIRHIYEFMNYLMSHLVVNEPEDPVVFLQDLLDRCIKFRDEFGKPPLLFSEAHIKSLYYAFDPFERGYITLEQYHEAIKSMGLLALPYIKQPPLNEEGFVNETDFLFEVNGLLTEHLRRLVRIPAKWEESIHRYTKKMSRMQSKETKGYGNDDKKEYLGEQESRTYNYGKRLSVYDTKPPEYRINARKEPKQLYLN